MTDLHQVSENLFRFTDTCNVYLVRSGNEAVLIDFGDGDVLAALPALGIARVTDVLMTHHHRDQGQGLAGAVAAGARVWAPQAEQDLFRRADAPWQARELYNNYNTRQDTFSLLEPIPLAGTLNDYAVRRFGAHTFTVVPTPGHTAGSISLMSEIDGQRVAFTGDLIAAPGKVWSLAATQWAYSGEVSGAEGVAASIPSLLDLKSRAPSMLLPSHGAPIQDPEGAIDLLLERLWALLRHRNHNLRLFEWMEHPYTAITPHLLRNRTSVAYSYVLLSQTGAALLIDFGYDMMTGFASGTERAARRPWLYTLAALKSEFGVTKVEAVVPTHYHDDHVAGMNLLREVEGTEVWAPTNFADILEHPARHDLPCLWFDPIPVDRVLPLGQPVQWQEYTLSLYELPGHTPYAVAIAFDVDGRRVLATGDEYQGTRGEQANYVYKNGFQPDDYSRAAKLYCELQPDLILTGHWDPLWVRPGYFDELLERGETLKRLHQDLQPSGPGLVNSEAFCVSIRPYQAHLRGGQCLEFEVHVRNPFERLAQVQVRLVIPASWRVAEKEVQLAIAPHAESIARFQVTPLGEPATRRACIAADLSVDGIRFGQCAEAFVTVEP